MAGGALLIKKLAYYNKSTRDKSLRRIIDAWLPSQHQISDEDMKKLWKGLFYCLWHADKVTIHTDLIECLSSLLLELPLSVALNYLSVFLLTLCREWPGIDSLRLDKFYNLIRRFVYCLFALLKKNSWDLQLSSKFMHVLEERVFFVDEAIGVKYHIVSVFIEELKKFLPVKKQVMEILLCRFILFMEKSRNKLLVTKIKSNVFDEVLEMGKRLLRANSSDNVGLDLEDNKDLMIILGADSAKTQNLVPYNITSSKAKNVSDGNKRKRKRKLASFDFDVVMSNLLVQFEIVASEMGLGEKESRSKKAVSFCMQKNLVWQPHDPLPPKSVRIPQSLRPRGSALKKGIPPGPIRDILPLVAKKRVELESLKRTRHVKKRSSRST